MEGQPLAEPDFFFIQCLIIYGALVAAVPAVIKYAELRLLDDGSLMQKTTSLLLAIPFIIFLAAIHWEMQGETGRAQAWFEYGNICTILTIVIVALYAIGASLLKDKVKDFLQQSNAR